MNATLTVCIVIKNEEKNINACLSSIKELADEIVILDTGSTDNSISVIKEWRDDNGFRDCMELLEVGTAFHDDAGDFHFGNAKQAALDEVSSEYAMWLDGSDVVSDQVKLRKVFNKAVTLGPDFCIELNTILADISFPRNRIFPKNAGKFVYAVHEGVVFDRTLQTFTTDVVITHSSTGNRLDSVRRNLRILTKEWARERHHRTAFYLGASYMDIKNYEMAIEYFRARITEFDVTLFRDETFKAYESICACTYALIKSGKSSGVDFVDMCEDLLDFDDTMREGYFYSAMAAFLRGNAVAGNRYLNECLAISDQKPSSYTFWINPSIYNDDYIRRHLK